MVAIPTQLLNLYDHGYRNVGSDQRNSWNDHMDGSLVSFESTKSTGKFTTAQANLTAHAMALTEVATLALRQRTRID